MVGLKPEESFAPVPAKVKGAVYAPSLTGLIAQLRSAPARPISLPFLILLTGSHQSSVRNGEAGRPSLLYKLQPAGL